MLPGIGSNVPQWYTRPLTHITPLSLSDGATYERKLDALYNYVTGVLVSELDGVLDGWFTEYKADHEKLLQDIADQKASWQDLFDKFIADIVAQLEGLNDQSMANLVRKSTSETYKAIEELFDTLLAPQVADLENSIGDIDRKVEGFKETIATVDRRIDKSRAIVWSLDVRMNNNPAYLYYVYEIHSNGFVPGLIEKHFTGDYEQTRQEGEELRPPQAGIYTHFRETGASLVANASAWATTGTADGRMTGLQIKNGVFYQGFATSPKGRDAIGVDRAGKFHILRNGRDSIASIKAMGITDTFTYGPPLTENGAKEDHTDIAAEWAGFSDKRPRSFIGQKSNGNVVYVQIVGDGVGRPGASPQDCADLAMTLGLTNSLLLDGGGSTQALAGGNEVVRSSDATARVLPETIAFMVPYANGGGARPIWDTLPSSAGLTGDFKIRSSTSGERRVFMRGNITGVTAINTVVAVVAPQYRPNDWIYLTVPCIMGGLTVMATAILKSNGELQITRKDGQEWLATDRYDFNIDEVLN